ncbi:hypothetical protein BX616_008716, partial [Lobosporangium transversale]
MASSSMLWHHIPGRLHSVSVADKSNIWGVTLDYQLCRLDPNTQQWQFVAVTSESDNQARFSSLPTQSAESAQSTPYYSSATSTAMAAKKKVQSLIPASLGQSLGLTGDSITSTNRPLQQQQRLMHDNLMAFITDEDTDVDADADTTLQVSAAADGTVLVQLKAPVTTGAGYNRPNFTSISVGHDNIVLATDAHTGTVFRLKTHPSVSHPPLWTALPGTGTFCHLPSLMPSFAGSAITTQRLHMTSCTLSSADYIVGVAADGQVYRFCNNAWISMGGGAKFESVGVGVDGYVIGVDQDGDLFGCQLQSTIMVPGLASSSEAREAVRIEVSSGVSVEAQQQMWQKQDDDTDPPSSPKAPNQPSIPATPRLQGMPKRPLTSPRELFEISGTTFSSFSQNQIDQGQVQSRRQGERQFTAPLVSKTDNKNNNDSTPSSPAISRSNSFMMRYLTPARSGSQLSKKSSYASENGSAQLSPKARLNFAQVNNAENTRDIQQNISQQPMILNDTSTTSKGTKNTPLRIQTALFNTYGAPEVDSNDVSSRPLVTTGIRNGRSPSTDLPLDKNPYPPELFTPSQAASINNENNGLHHSNMSMNSSEPDYFPLSTKLTNTGSESQWQNQTKRYSSDKQEFINDDKDEVPLSGYQTSSSIRNDHSRGGSSNDDVAAAAKEYGNGYTHQGMRSNPTTALSVSTPGHPENGFGVSALSGKSEWIEDAMDPYNSHSHGDISLKTSLKPDHDKKQWDSSANDHSNINDSNSHNNSSNYSAPIYSSPTSPKTLASGYYSPPDTYQDRQTQSRGQTRNQQSAQTVYSRGPYYHSPPLGKSSPSHKQEFLHSTSNKEEGASDGHRSFEENPAAAPTLLYTRRSSSASEILMLQQQQEYLRLTRLRSEPASTSCDNIPASQASISSNNNNHNSNHFSKNYQNRGSVASFSDHYGDLLIEDNQATAVAAAARATRPYVTQEDYPSTIVPSPVKPATIRYNDPFMHANNDIEMDSLPKHGLGNGNEGSRDTSGRPSCSSSQLDTTVTGQPAPGLRRNDRCPSTPNRSMARPVTMNESGIQGEDAQGRWIGGSTGPDARVTSYNQD